MIFRACNVFPAASSTRADAIHPGPCFGLVSRTDLSNSRALVISPTSAVVATLVLLKLVKYPEASKLVCCPETCLSKLIPNTVPRAALSPEMLVTVVIPPSIIVLAPIAAVPEVAS